MNWTFWLSLVGAAAWVPVVVNALFIAFRKIHPIFLDKRLIWNTVTDFKGKKAHGSMLIIAVNLFTYYKPFFAKDITCEIKLKNLSIKNFFIPYEGKTYFNDENGNKFVIDVPPEKDINISRAIINDKENIKIISIFMEKVDIRDIEEIEEITLYFQRNRLIKKKLSFKMGDYKETGIIDTVTRKIDTK